MTFSEGTTAKIGLTAEMTQKALEALRVHQVELQMQNEELRQIQHKLDAERERYFDLYDLAPVGYCTISAAGLILEANLSLATMLGVARVHLVQHRLSHYLHGDDSTTIYYQFCKQLLASRMAQTCELQMASKSGQPFWTRLMATAMPGKNDEVVLRIVLSDITEQRRTTRQLEEVSAEQAAILNSDIVGIIRLKDRTFVWVNDLFARLLGYAPDELIGQPSSIFYANEEEALALARAAYPVIASGHLFHAEQRFMRKDGGPFWAEVSACLLKPGSQESIWSFIDINERKRMQAALSTSEALFKLIFNEAPLGIALTDSATGHIQVVNPMFARIVGRSVEEISRIDWMSITHPDDLQEDMDKMALLKTGRITGFRVEKRYLRPGGEPVWINMTIAALELTNNNAERRHLCIVEDISERKRMEEQVRQFAFFDALTALPNRRLLMDRMSQAISASKRSGCYGALIFLDLDNFKPLNDQHGHAAGDLLLIEASRRLNEGVRAVDTVARLGGDEFVVLLGSLSTNKLESTAQARRIAEAFRSSLALPYVFSSPSSNSGPVAIEHHCSASIGVVMFNTASHDPQQLLKWADAAMYQAKQAGRNRVQLYAGNT